MTRVILTNKETGQSLPEAEVLYRDDPASPYAAIEIEFDGTSEEQSFSLAEWDVTDVQPAAVYGDVFRRVDRADSAQQYVIAVHLGSQGWHEINPIDRTIFPLEDIAITRYVGAVDGAWERA